MNEPTYIDVNPDDDGQRVDRWLKKHVPAMPFGLAQKLIRKGAIRVNNKKTKTSNRLEAGQTVRIPVFEDRGSRQSEDKARFSEQDKAYIESLVIHDDGDIVVINKPGGLPSQGGGQIKKHVDGLLQFLADKKGRRPKLIHRLDRDTSGVLLCARRPETIRLLGKAFKNRQVQKTYWALVVPTPENMQGTIKAPLEKGAGSMKDRMYVSEGEDSKSAVTDFMVVEHAHKTAAFMAFMPLTGRTHQIRVHTADVLGCPILGDDKYGKGEAVIEGIGISDTLHLHARSLKIQNPKTGEDLFLKAPLPSALKKSWDALGFNIGEADQICEDFCTMQS